MTFGSAGLNHPPAAFLSSPDVWQRGHGPNHPLKPERLERTHYLVEAYGLLESPAIELVSPRPATEAELALFHTREYIDAVRALSAGESGVPAAKFNFGPGDNPAFPGMYDSEGLKVGSALQAAERLHAGSHHVAFSYSGGLHHAGPDFAHGFCVFNDPVIAIRWLNQQGWRVAYVDIDVHHGDGVQNAFYDTDQVLTISLHQDPRTLFPGTGLIDEIGTGAGRGYSLNLPLPAYTQDELYLWAFDAIVPEAVEVFGADILVTQLGVDTHYRDPLAHLALTTHAHQALFERLSQLSERWLAFGGGGYNLDVVPRSWTLALAGMAGQQPPSELPGEYVSRYGGSRLHDSEQPPVASGISQRNRGVIEQTVAELRALIDWF